MSVLPKDDCDLPSAAMALWDRGFHVIPLGTPDERPPERHLARHGKDITKAVALWPKTPRIAWRKYQTEQPTREEVETWWHQWPHANIGLLTGSVIVVDADSADAVAFVESGEITRSPWRVNTAKGAHFYYQRNPSIEIRNSASKQRIDLRGFGGYVVAPPSVHHTGAIYQWIIDAAYGADSILDLPILNGNDLHKIGAFNDHGESAEQTDTPSEKSSAVKGAALNVDISSIKHSNQGEPVALGGRNNAAASLAGKYIHAGMPLDKVRALLITWNDRNEPPLNMQELMTVIDSVNKTHQHNHHKTIASAAQIDHGRVDPDLLVPDRPTVMFKNLGELQSATIVQPSELWGERLLFAKARVLIAGAPKIGKTDFILELAIRLACGGEMLGWPANGPVTVAYLNAEVIDYYMRERVMNISSHLDRRSQEMLNANLFVTGRTDLDLLSTAGFYALFDEIERIRPDVIIVDPLANLHTGNEDKSTEMRRVLARLDVLADINHSSIVMVHHIRKGVVGGHGVDPFDAIRGTSAFRGWGDTNIMLYGADNMTMAAFEVRNGPSPNPMPVWFDRDHGLWRIGTPDIAITGTGHNVSRERINAVVDVLRVDGAMLRKELIEVMREKLSISQRSAEALINATYEAPGVQHRRDGKNIYLWVKTGV